MTILYIVNDLQWQSSDYVHTTTYIFNSDQCSKELIKEVDERYKTNRSIPISDPDKFDLCKGSFDRDGNKLINGGIDQISGVQIVGDKNIVSIRPTNGHDEVIMYNFVSTFYGTRV